MVQEIKKDIYWIGVDNSESRDFHGIHTPRGGSYNSYLIVDEKLTIIDGTNVPFFDVYMESLKEKISPEEISYIVVNHAEPDHTGAIKEMLDSCVNAKIICTKKCEEFLKVMYSIEREMIVVSEGEEVSIGSRTLKFIMDPMCHWPETMVTYIKEEKILFPADLFGTEISHEQLFADEMEDFSKITRDYFTIVMRPFHKMVKMAIDKIRELEIEYIAPSHGPVYRKDVSKIIDHYEKLCSSPEEEKAVIVNYTIWNSSKKMAEEIEMLLKEKGLQVSNYDITKANFVELMAEALTSKYVILGSMTIDNHYYPLYDALFGFLGLNDQKGKKVGVFGTHGWAPAAVPKLKAKLGELGYNVVSDVDLRFGMRIDEDKDKVREFVSKID